MQSASDKQNVAITVEMLNPSTIESLRFLVSSDKEKRSVEFWLNETIVRGYEYNKRLMKNASDREKFRQGEKDKSDFQRAIANDATILQKPEMLLQLAKTYNQLDSIVVQALLGQVAEKAKSAVAAK